MNITSRNFFITMIGATLILASFIPLVSFAEADKIDPEQLVEQAKTAYEEHVGPGTKNFFARMFASLEKFRIDTAAKLEEKRAAKAAEYDAWKREEIHSLTSNAEQVLNGEQKTLYEGAGSRVGFGKILARVALAGLGILIFIFASQMVFYVILIVLILALIKATVDKLRAPRPIR